MFESLATRLSGGRHAPSNAYPPDQAREKFNADWAAAAVFDTVEDFATDHKQGLLVAIHRNKVSDAYLVFLFDDYPAVKEQPECSDEDPGLCAFSRGWKRGGRGRGPLNRVRRWFFELRYCALVF